MSSKRRRKTSSSEARKKRQKTHSAKDVLGEVRQLRVLQEEDRERGETTLETLAAAGKLDFVPALAVTDMEDGAVGDAIERILLDVTKTIVAGMGLKVRRKIAVFSFSRVRPAQCANSPSL